MVLGKLDFHMQNTEGDLYLLLCTKVNSKQIKDLNVRCKTLKLPEKNIEETFQEIGMGKDSLNRTPKAQEMTGRINIWDCIKLKSFCTPKSTITRVKR
jgi:hypothetical protein